MKKLKTLSVALLILALAGLGASCGSNSMLGTVFSGGTVANVFTSVIGLDKVTAKGLVGTWDYNGPGIAFTSENLLAKAGGEVAATKIEKEIKPYYDKVGISVTNTYAVFDADNNYTVSVAGKKFSGKYTFDEANAKITMKGLLFDINCYAKREYGGIALLFESKKLLTILQTMAALSNDDTYKKFGELSKNYEGIRIGFDMKKKK